MVILFFSCLDPQGNYQKSSYGGPDIDACFDALSSLVNAGWQLKRATLFTTDLIDRQRIMATTEVLDGVPLDELLHRLRQEWEQLVENGTAIPDNNGLDSC